MEKFEHFQHILLLFGLNHSFLFLMLALKTPFLVTNNDNRVGMVDVVHEPIDDKQAEMDIWPSAVFFFFILRGDICM